MSLFSSLLKALGPKYTAVLIGEEVRLGRIQTGTTESTFRVGPGATSAIAQGDNVIVTYRKGGTKVYTKTGSIVSFNGVCQ
jgi:hypothetical protein